MKLEKLNEPLTRENIDFRVSHLFKSGDIVYAFILAYKDARVDMQVLDNAVGQMNWQTDYKRDSKGILQCGIGIYDTEKIGWVWKWSNGIPSNTEAEKGEYSDAFKRAGFMWGIGRKLYDFCTIMVTCQDKEYFIKENKPKANGKFRPNDWQWEISEDYQKVTAKQNGNIRFTTEKRGKQKTEKEYDSTIMDAIKAAENAKTLFELEGVWNKYKEHHTHNTFISAVSEQKEKLSNETG